MLTLDRVQTVGLAALALLVGEGLVAALPGARRLNLPGSVLGGGGIAAVLFFFPGLIRMDASLQGPLMLAFFASLGFGASWRVLRAGGRDLIVFLALCTVYLLLQNLLGIGLAYGLGLPPLVGLLTGSVALAGGPGTTLAFAPLFERSGVVGAGAVGLAAAFSGIVLGGLTGAPLGTWLHRKSHRMGHGQPSEIRAARPAGVDGLWGIVALLLAMWLGGYVSAVFEARGLTLPGYLGAMIVAAIVRNCADLFTQPVLDFERIEDAGSIALSLFIALALLNLDFAHLARIAGPLLAIVVVQTGAVLAFAAWIIDPWAGKGRDGALISAGFVGFMLGTTANAMANMQTLARKFGHSRRAYLIVPLVGACFIDFVNAAAITAFLNFMK